jgi:hypothetical protein
VLTGSDDAVGSDDPVGSEDADAALGSDDSLASAVALGSDDALGAGGSVVAWLTDASLPSGSPPDGSLPAGAAGTSVEDVSSVAHLSTGGTSVLLMSISDISEIVSSSPDVQAPSARAAIVKRGRVRRIERAS